MASYFSPTDNNKNQQSMSIRDTQEVCSVMEGSTAIDGTVASTGVTSFANEACEAVQVNESYVSSSVAEAQPDLQDIKGYFARPRLINSGSLGSLRNRVFSNIINTNILAGYFPQWASRLSGAYGIRYKLNFRLQVASTPFHQGVLAMSFQYGTSGLVNNANYYARSTYSASCTNLPHVRLDLSESTMVELAVPFVYEQEYALVETSSTAQLGVMALNIILPLISVTGLPAPTYKLYIYLTDIELYGADNNNPTTITLQSGLSEFGAELKQARVLSKGLDGVAKASSFVAKNIPSLSSFAGPVAWAAGTAAGIAKYLGFSRPLLQDPVMRVFRGQYTSESNVDVPMAGFTCGLMQSNTLAISPEIGATNVDEMSLAYITSQWSQICVGRVSTTDTHNLAVYASPVSPASMWFRAPASAPYCNIPFPAGNTTGANHNSIMPSSLMNIASYFRMWRGDFKYRITFAKTKFHGGRYMISFNPSTIQRFYQGAGVISTIDGPENVSSLVQPYGYSKIMDLRDGNVFEFEVPYMSSEPYVTFCSSIGGISIVCIDPLLDNPSVCSSIPFLVEVCGSNFELADFAGPWFSSIPQGVIREQSGEVVMGPTVNNASSLTIGEKIMSAKQMIQAPSWYLGAFSQGTNKWLVYPWYYSKTTSYFNLVNATPLPANLFISGNTTCASLAKLYAFVRGGTDHHIYPLQSTGVSVVFDQCPYESAFEYGSSSMDTAFRQGTGSTPKVVSVGDTPLHVRSPAFQNRLRLRSTVLDSFSLPVIGENTFVDGTNIRGHVDRVTINSALDNQPFWYSKAASDDATMAQYMGPTPLALYNTAQLAFPDQDWYR